jgi:hypothetical protein
MISVRPYPFRRFRQASVTANLTEVFWRKLLTWNHATHIHTPLRHYVTITYGSLAEPLVRVAEAGEKTYPP